ncbi:MAG: LacI family DNA-binding transcriptional regulator [Actinomycetota bacterium]
MADVAKRAGVSLSTVSYVLSGDRPISAATRERVQQAMADLDFSPNVLARGLASQRSGIIALLLPTDESEADPFMAEIIVGAADAASRSDHHLLLWTEATIEATRLEKLTRQGLIDGALVLAVRLDDPRVSTLQTAGLPFTLIGRTADCTDIDYVDSDEIRAAELAIRHLAELGHERIAFLGPPPSQLDGGYGIMVRVVDGLVAAAEAAGIEVTVHPCERSPAAGRSLVRHVLSSMPETTAAIVMNDPSIGGVLAGLDDADHSVPGDFSLLGLFTTPMVAELTSPRLTTVAPSAGQIGQLAAEALIAGLRSRDRTVRQELVSATLTIRDSTARRRVRLS